MTTPDEQFEGRLRDVTSEADPVPTGVIDSAKALFVLRDLDAELAELVSDSLVDAPEVLTRALVADVRMLTFSCGDVTVELDVDTDPVSGRVAVHGVVVGPVSAATLVHTAGRVPVPLDEDGHLDFGLPIGGPIRLELARTDGGRITTVWVTV